MNIIPFPTQLTAPVQQQGRPGRHPKGVASLRRARRKRLLAAEVAVRQEQRECQLLRHMEACLFEMYRLRGIIKDAPPKTW